MITKIRKIGNSSGVLIPKSILMASEITDEYAVKISVADGKIIIEKAEKPRAGWREAIKRAQTEADQHFPIDLVNKFDEEEWTWE